MGLIAEVYKTAGLSHDGTPQSWSNGGLSERFDKVTIVNAEGPFDPQPERPAVLLVRGNLAGTVKAVPAKMLADGTWVEDRPDYRLGPMMGGCYVGTSDSRLGEAVAMLGGPRYGFGLIALHDRYETAQQHRALSV